MKYPKHESKTLDYKQELPSPKQIVRTVIGFCNLFGGRLVIGVDNERNIVGLDEDKVQLLMEFIEKTIYESSTPAILPQIYTQRLDDKLILVIEVSAGMRKPYFITSEGMNKGTYVRVGRNTVRANSDLLDELKLQAKGKTFDESAVYHLTQSDLDNKKLETFFLNDVKYSKQNIDKDLLKSYNLLVEEQKQFFPSVAAVLLFGRYPQKNLTESFIICTHFTGTAGREALASKDCTGTLFEQFHEAFAFITSRLNVAYSIKGTKRIEKLEVPQEAIREVLINAIVHRSYSIKAPTKVAIFDDRIEFFSPGMFPGPINVERLQDGITYIRNTVITRIFREAGLVEKLGSGFITLFESYTKANLNKPLVVEGDNFVKCILPRKSAGQVQIISSDEEQILALAHAQQEITTTDVVHALAVSRATASKKLSQLFKSGRLTKVGKGPATRYMLAQVV